MPFTANRSFSKSHSNRQFIAHLASFFRVVNNLVRPSVVVVFLFYGHKTKCLAGVPSAPSESTPFVKCYCYAQRAPNLFFRADDICISPQIRFAPFYRALIIKACAVKISIVNSVCHITLPRFRRVSATNAERIMNNSYLDVRKVHP